MEMEIKTDEELFQLFLKGMEEAFTKLVERYQEPLLGFAYKILGDREKAEEVFQETFVRIFRYRKSFRPGKTFRAWIYTIALHLCRDEMRKKASTVSHSQSLNEGMEEEILHEAISPDSLLASQEMESIIEEGLAQLSPKHREVLVLYHFQELKYEEISQILGRKIGTIKSQLHYALNHLKKVLEPKLNSYSHPPQIE
ncbi:MAG: RNA polymerase sigma factor [Planctomycetota bacterium]|nr:MAG: RNA polymerase sigma factor [Planctomycetota bacterium]